MAVVEPKLCKNCVYCTMPAAIPLLATLSLAIVSKRDDFSNAVCNHPSSPVDPVAGTQKLQCMLQRLKSSGPYCQSMGLWYKAK